MRTGQKNQAKITGRIIYGHDGTDAYPIYANSAQAIRLGQREPFIFRPGGTALASGMVASGTRSGAATIAAAGTANQTYWGTEVVYEPARAGKIDGLSTGGVVSGQLTVGVSTTAATATAKLTARIRNKGGTWTTALALTGTMSCTTAEIYRTYDIPYLYTTANFNAVPFGVAIGVESNEAGTATQARIMESSYIQAEFEPGT